MKQSAKRAGENEVYVVGDIVRTQCGQLGRVRPLHLHPPPHQRRTQVIAVELADEKDYLSMRLHLKLAQSKGRGLDCAADQTPCREWHNT